MLGSLYLFLSLEVSVSGAIEEFLVDSLVESGLGSLCLFLSLEGLVSGETTDNDLGALSMGLEGCSLQRTLPTSVKVSVETSYFLAANQAFRSWTEI